MAETNINPVPGTSPNKPKGSKWLVIAIILLIAIGAGAYLFTSGKLFKGMIGGLGESEIDCLDEKTFETPPDTLLLDNYYNEGDILAKNSTPMQKGNVAWEIDENCQDSVYFTSYDLTDDEVTKYKDTAFISIEARVTTQIATEVPDEYQGIALMISDESISFMTNNTDKVQTINDIYGVCIAYGRNDVAEIEANGDPKSLGFGTDGNNFECFDKDNLPSGLIRVFTNLTLENIQAPFTYFAMAQGSTDKIYYDELSLRTLPLTPPQTGSSISNFTVSEYKVNPTSVELSFKDNSNLDANFSIASLDLSFTMEGVDEDGLDYTNTIINSYGDAENLSVNNEGQILSDGVKFKANIPFTYPDSHQSFGLEEYTVNANYTITDVDGEEVMATPQTFTVQNPFQAKLTCKVSIPSFVSGTAPAAGQFAYIFNDETIPNDNNNNANTYPQKVSSLLTECGVKTGFLDLDTDEWINQVTAGMICNPGHQVEVAGLEESILRDANNGAAHPISLQPESLIEYTVTNGEDPDDPALGHGISDTKIFSLADNNDQYDYLNCEPLEQPHSYKSNLSNLNVISNVMVLYAYDKSVTVEVGKSISINLESTTGTDFTIITQPLKGSLSGIYDDGSTKKVDYTAPESIEGMFEVITFQFTAGLGENTSPPATVEITVTAPEPATSSAAPGTEEGKIEIKYISSTSIAGFEFEVVGLVNSEVGAASTEQLNYIPTITPIYDTEGIKNGSKVKANNSSDSAYNLSGDVLLTTIDYVGVVAEACLENIIFYDNNGEILNGETTVDGCGSGIIKIGFAETEIVNTAPVAENIALKMDPTNMGSVNLQLKASDFDNDTITFELHEDPLHGTAYIHNNNNPSLYYAEEGYYGEVTFKYIAFDGINYSEPATVTITITAGDDLVLLLHLDENPKPENTYSDESIYGWGFSNIVPNNVDSKSDHKVSNSFNNYASISFGTGTGGYISGLIGIQELDDALFMEKDEDFTFSFFYQTRNNYPESGKWIGQLQDYAGDLNIVTFNNTVTPLLEIIKDFTTQEIILNIDGTKHNTNYISPDNKWEHFTISRKWGNLILYVDGVEKFRTNHNTEWNITNIKFKPQYQWVMRGWEELDDTLNNAGQGILVDEIMFTKTALTSEEFKMPTVPFNYVSHTAKNFASILNANVAKAASGNTSARYLKATNGYSVYAEIGCDMGDIIHIGQSSNNQSAALDFTSENDMGLKAIVTLPVIENPDSKCAEPPAPDERNIKPVAGPDVELTQQETAVVVDVLANDYDLDVDDEIFVHDILQVPTKGTATISEDKKTIKYKPNAGSTGTDTFVYQIIDNHDLKSNRTAVKIYIGACKYDIANEIRLQLKGVFQGIYQNIIISIDANKGPGDTYEVTKNILIDMLSDKMITDRELAGPLLTDPEKHLIRTFVRVKINNIENYINSGLISAIINGSIYTTYLEVDSEVTENLEHYTATPVYERKNIGNNFTTNYPAIGILDNAGFTGPAELFNYTSTADEFGKDYAFFCNSYTGLAPVFENFCRTVQASIPYIEKVPVFDAKYSSLGPHNINLYINNTLKAKELSLRFKGIGLNFEDWIPELNLNENETPDANARPALMEGHCIEIIKPEPEPEPDRCSEQTKKEAKKYLEKRYKELNNGSEASPETLEILFGQLFEAHIAYQYIDVTEGIEEYMGEDPDVNGDLSTDHLDNQYKFTRLASEIRKFNDPQNPNSIFTQNTATFDTYKNSSATPDNQDFMLFVIEDGKLTMSDNGFGEYPPKIEGMCIHIEEPKPEPEPTDYNTCEQDVLKYVKKDLSDNHNIPDADLSSTIAKLWNDGKFKGKKYTFDKGQDVLMHDQPAPAGENKIKFLIQDGEKPRTNIPDSSGPLAAAIFTENPKLGEFTYNLADAAGNPNADTLLFKIPEPEQKVKLDPANIFLKNNPDILKNLWNNVGAITGFTADKPVRMGRELKYSLTLNWDEFEDNWPSKIHYSRKGSETVTIDIGSNITNIIIYDLSPGVYKFAIKAYDGEILTASSEELPVTIKAEAEIEIPRGATFNLLNSKYGMASVFLVQGGGTYTIPGSIAPPVSGPIIGLTVDPLSIPPPLSVTVPADILPAYEAVCLELKEPKPEPEPEQPEITLECSTAGNMATISTEMAKILDYEGTHYVVVTWEFTDMADLDIEYPGGMAIFTPQQIADMGYSFLPVSAGPLVAGGYNVQVKAQLIPLDKITVIKDENGNIINGIFEQGEYITVEDDAKCVIKEDAPPPATPPTTENPNVTDNICSITNELNVVESEHVTVGQGGYVDCSFNDSHDIYYGDYYGPPPAQPPVQPPVQPPAATQPPDQPPAMAYNPGDFELALGECFEKTLDMVPYQDIDTSDNPHKVSLKTLQGIWVEVAVEALGTAPIMHGDRLNVLNPYYGDKTVKVYPKREVVYAEAIKVITRSTCLLPIFAKNINLDILDLKTKVFSKTITSVPNDHWIKLASNVFYEIGLIDANFEAAKVMDRLTLIPLIWNTFEYVTGKKCPANETSSLTDISGISNENLFHCARNIGIYEGVILGGKNVARPNATIDREELATLAVNTMVAIANTKK